MPDNNVPCRPETVQDELRYQKSRRAQMEAEGHASRDQLWRVNVEIQKQERRLAESKRHWIRAVT